MFLDASPNKLPPTAEPCFPNPCQNQAICRIRGDSYSCFCVPGFQGAHCQIDVNECASQPCRNGATCVDRVGRFSCLCLPGFTGSLLLAQRYSCDCSQTTFTGSHCEKPLPHCYSDPCFNSAICEDSQGNYTCECWPGANCDVTLVGCEGHECQNQGSCSPFLLDETHGYICSCTPGYTGPLCNTPTTFSFERRGYLLLHNPLLNADLTCNITLSFKTVLPSALLFQRNIWGLLLRLELEGGQLVLALRWEESAGTEVESQALELRHNVTDGEWHTVEAVLTNSVLSLRLLSDAGNCGIQSCHKVTPVQSTLIGLETSPQNTFIGGSLEDPGGSSRYPASPAFIGCMRDVFVDWQLVVPVEWLSDSTVNVSPGCSHRDRCRDEPCQNRGQCVNLWQSYQCQCARPYKGHDCEEEHVPGRFGNEDSDSLAAFSITDDLAQNLSISLFLRTRRKNGLLLVLANSSSPYLHMWLEAGRVTLRLHNSESLKARRAIHDGEVHFVNVEVLDGQMSLYVAGQKQGDADVRTVDVQAGDGVFVGGLLEKRTTSEFGGFFKGCIQDLRINDRRLQFFGLDTSVRSYPLEFMENVTAGCSGDNTCSVSKHGEY
ncbi:hypothetical protein XENOCAPTIV_030825 [Xenoophorus captivus]|uniref:Crumbs cell polarity complex component 1 n=1 Tax=Xenoophorus captivus TaxID=1517983 RepID=A0ABV0R5T0_9TELE